ncbi:DUF5776 domain-containing protein [Plantactinospora veratri]
MKWAGHILRGLFSLSPEWRKQRSGTPRLKTKSGYYLTANKKFVKKI